MTHDEIIERIERLEGRMYNLDKQYIDLKSMVGSVRASISKLAERFSRSLHSKKKTPFEVLEQWKAEQECQSLPGVPRTVDQYKARLSGQYVQEGED